MKMKLAIIVGKILIFVLNKLGRGSSLPGHIALKIDNRLLYKIKLPKNIIAVTGSSGKGSVSNSITNTLRDMGYSVLFNDLGSNLTDGITSSIISKIKLNGQIKEDYLVMEIDERYIKYVFKAISPNYLVITNITRDQPPRNGHFDLVINEIKKGLNKNMHLILNSDDPILRTFEEKNTTYYSLDKQNESYKENKFANLNVVYCPKCHTKLKYNFYHFEATGNYYCESCGFKNPTPSYKATNVNYDKKEITIDNKQVKIEKDLLYSVYNTLAVYTTLRTLKLDSNKIIESINKVTVTSDSNYYKYNKRNVYVLSNKAENATTFNQSILFTERHKKNKTIVIGWKEISRRYAFDDLSWLYDIDFELLKNQKIDKILCVGWNRYDIATRLKLAGIDEDIIIIEENLDNAVKYVKDNTSGDIFGIFNFDYVEPFNNLMKEVVIK